MMWPLFFKKKLSLSFILYVQTYLFLVVGHRKYKPLRTSLPWWNLGILMAFISLVLNYDTFNINSVFYTQYTASISGQAIVRFLFLPINHLAIS